MRKVSLVVLGLFAACGGSPAKKPIVKPEPVVDTRPPPPPPPKPLTPEERLAFHATCFDDFVKEVPEFFTRCYSADSSEELVDDGEGPKVGTPAIAASTRPLWDAFDLEGESRMVLANGDNVLVIALLRGTQQKAFAGVPPTGKTFGVFVAEVMNLDDQGRHGVVRDYVDLAGMIDQLGGGPKGAEFRKPYDATGRPPYQVIAAGNDAETANVAAVQAGFDKFNQKDWKGVAGIYTDDAAIYEQVAPADTEGAKAIGKYFAELGKAFPDGQEKVDALWGAGDFVVAEATFTGTNNGASPSRGIKKATKKPVTIRQAHVFRLDGGKVIQHWIFENGAALGIQLGLIAPPAPPPSPPPTPPTPAPAG